MQQQGPRVLLPDTTQSPQPTLTYRTQGQLHPQHALSQPHALLSPGDTATLRSRSGPTGWRRRVGSPCPRLERLPQSRSHRRSPFHTGSTLRAHQLACSDLCRVLQMGKRSVKQRTRERSRRALDGGSGVQVRKDPDVKPPARRGSPSGLWEWRSALGVRKRTSTPQG